MRYWLILVLLTMGIAQANILPAQQGDRYDIYLQSGTDWVQPNFSDFLSGNAVEEEVVEGKVFLLFQFSRALSDAEKQSMKDAGLHLWEYIPNHAWICSYPAGFDRNRLANFPIRAVAPMPHPARIRGSLMERPLPQWAVKAPGTVDVRILPYPGLSREGFQRTLTAMGYEVLNAPAEVRWLEARSNDARIENLLNSPYVQFIEPVDPPEQPENYVARGQHRSTALYSGHPNARKYDGTGVVVAMGDDGDIGPHIDYTGRFSNNFSSSDFGTHGDHVSGTIFGAGNLDPEMAGMAPGAFLYAYSGGQSVLLGSVNAHNNNDVMITSTSQSNGCNAGYTLLSQTVDNNIYDNPSLIMVYSAGNEGPENCNYGAGPGWGNVTGGHKIGKNCITVGALNSSDFIASFSSRGPAHDGRLKPEVCGKGTAQLSTQPGNTYNSAQGTSMSCPGVSGVMAQLYHAYRDLNSGNDPKSGLIKAVLMNNCDDLGNPGPDYIHGYGRINALNAVEALENFYYFSGTLSTSQADTFLVTVAPGKGRLKFMTYWHDKEASSSASVALVNNLNMRVIDPNGNTYNPWVLDPTPTPAALNADATRGIDNLNNHEQVTLDTVVPGLYRVIVEGTSVPQGPQEFFMTYALQDSGVRITYPLGGEEMVPTGFERIYWDAVGDHGTFSLEYSTDNGANWTVINNSIPGDDRFTTWPVPGSIQATGQGMFRITRGTESDVTDLPIVFAKQPGNLRVAASCPNSFTLGWDSVPGAVAYQVTRLGATHMDSIGRTTGLTFTVNGFSQFDTDWFSVQVVTAEGTLGRRAIAFQKTPGIFMCQEPDDIGISRVVTPGNGPVNSCGTGTVNPVLEIENFSPDTLTGFPVSYSLNGGLVVTETFNGTLPPYGKANHTFVATINLTSPGIYSVKGWTGNAGDTNPINDTLTSTTEVFAGSTVTLPYVEDFESYSVCSAVATCNVSCALLNGHHNASNNVVDDMDWRPDAAGTLTNGTGPPVDHTTNSTSGIYAYLEGSNCTNSVGEMITPCIDLTTAVEPELSFWFYSYGEDMGELHVDVFAGGEWFLDVTAPIVGEWGEKWWERLVDLSQWNGMNVTVRFRGITGDGALSDIAIDDISVTENFIGIEDALLTGIQIYPNPSEGRVAVRFEEGAQATGFITLSNLSGQVLRTKQFVAGDNQVQLNGEDLPAGVYVITVRSGEGARQLKWVKL